MVYLIVILFCLESLCGSKIGLEQTQYRTHTIRGTKPALTYNKTKHLGLVNSYWAIKNLKARSYLGI